jgi:S-adenosylmethionine:tRNA ribosyltransferase-isomerase
MLLSDFDYDLPDEAIAQDPLDDRASSKLLHIDRQTGQMHDRCFRDVVNILQPGDLVVVNDTRVTALRLFGTKPTGARVEALLLQEEEPGTFIALLKPGKRLKEGAQIEFEDDLVATVQSNLDGARKRIVFEPKKDLQQRLESCGRLPLPPYIVKPLKNGERYQTVYASNPGSAAAPTAGLHFTSEIIKTLKHNGVQFATITLDVSVDTFRPVQVNDPKDHEMHGERCTIPVETAAAINATKGRIIGVGTTTVRTLESFAVGQKRVEPGTTISKLFIRPGYAFKVIDGMFTNFHMPKTTMLLMISALASHDLVMRSYVHALKEGYRFLSFGDSMLIL